MVAGLDKIVDEESAAMRNEWDDNIFTDATRDHGSIIRPKSIDDKPLGFFISELKKWIENEENETEYEIEDED